MREVEGDTGSAVSKELLLGRGDLRTLVGGSRYGQSSPRVREGAGVNYLLLLAA